jgi:UDP-N-acetyl-D-glucosamine dehydrogenase
MPGRKASTSRSRAATALLKKIEDRSAQLAVIGLGYVGLPLAVEFAKAGFRVHGIDINERRVRQLSRGRSYIQDVPTAEVSKLVKAGKLLPTTDFAVLKKADAVNVCVPTPLSKQRDPDVSYIVAASNQVAKYLHRGMLVILESTTYPGTTDELILPPFGPARVYGRFARNEPCGRDRRSGHGGRRD